MNLPPWPEADGRFDVKQTAESHFSWLRTRLSTERTLMSWVRTGTAMIGFGFTLVQFYEQLLGGQPTHLRFPSAPRYFGLALLLVGVVALVVSIWQYLQMLRYLHSKDFAGIAGLSKGTVMTPLISVAVMVVLVGLFATVSVLINFF